ncbi:2-C-methyl-D-erythritol 4-phosphate cytidylyltransferase [Flexithrix dorotheae]|uniref:2-C-methyl-D-erythritol 4-phosphate cytidylyltransferase n=1 Tax=Flexithrix dorotheae TaxID=70993 RepID=UPI000369D512|nr:2-C-methyl-D-erythritol 4-phosphate cytidylyltransferase [Flexithrix dorotheae]
MDIPKYAIIVAGGKGNRMNTQIPKQFIPLLGKPVLMHTIERFYFAASETKIILVLPQHHVEFWNNLVEKHNFKVPHQIAIGGASRFQSVKSGLNKIEEQEGLVAIHDGVRPFISKEIIDLAYQTANKKGNAIVAVQLKDSIREVSETGNDARDRNRYRLIQTPQTFKIGLIKTAYNTPETSFFTDDASVAEASGNEINLVEGSYYNIKITTPEDLQIAGIFAKKKWNNE